MKKNFSKEKFIGVIHKNQNLNTNESSLSMDIDLDPMFEKNSRQFDGADNKSLLLSKLTVKLKK